MDSFMAFEQFTMCRLCPEETVDKFLTDLHWLALNQCINVVSEKDRTSVLTQQVRKTGLVASRKSKHRNPFPLQSSLDQCICLCL